MTFHVRCLAACLVLSIPLIGCNDSGDTGLSDVSLTCDQFTVEPHKIADAKPSPNSRNDLVSLVNGYWEITASSSGSNYEGYVKFQADSARYIIALDKAVPWDVFDSSLATVTPSVGDDADPSCPAVGTFRYYNLGPHTYYMYFGPLAQPILKMTYLRLNYL